MYLRRRRFGPVVEEALKKSLAGPDTAIRIDTWSKGVYHIPSVAYGANVRSHIYHQYCSFPVGCFKCTRCHRDKRMDLKEGAYGMKRMRRDDLLFPGLVCNTCADEMYSEENDVMCERFAINLSTHRDFDCRFSALLTSDDELRNAITHHTRQHAQSRDVRKLDTTEIEDELQRRDRLRVMVAERIASRVHERREFDASIRPALLSVGFPQDVITLIRRKMSVPM